jgi:hypothetical protein
MADISEPFVVPLDVKCLEPGCNCFREAVPGHMTADGEYAAPQGEPDCPQCHHKSARHTVIGETKSEYEKQQAAKKPKV